VGPAVFNTVVGAQAPRRVRFPSASANVLLTTPIDLRGPIGAPFRVLDTVSFASAVTCGNAGAEGIVTRATKLEADLHAVAAALISILEPIEPERWTHVPGRSVWSVGKDAAHVAEAAVYHQWIVRGTIGQVVSSRRPGIERQEVTTTMTAQQAVDLIRRRTEESAALISSLSDEQLALPTRPHRARAQALADTIELVLIGHYDSHSRGIERKLRDRT
jgi:uncharacterized damage-inducible protein DinB